MSAIAGNGAAVAVELDDVTRVYHSSHHAVRALDGVNFSVFAGETLAVIGESGSGKSTLTRLVAGLERPTSGRIKVAGEPPRLRPGKVATAQVVFQDPAGSLNPHRSIGKSVAEPLHKSGRRRRRAIVGEMLERVGIDPARWQDRPARFSGGQLQRVAIARALVARSSVLVCDEPTSALDVSVQAQILSLLRDLQEEIGFSCIFVTHDLAVAQVVADRVLVLKDGRVRESAEAAAFFAGPRDDYSRALLDSMAGAPLDQASRAP
ncbi:MAG TPA: dipeptide/oligopeptide/nickel ABC transporter ATP-binding protein [Acidimicrobiales bacterium]|nr:dipeptide/oligopeptide/nickel ABC transporter ATP-binding protein [Acidimicrobiales bacterium]